MDGIHTPSERVGSALSDAPPFGRVTAVKLKISENRFAAIL